MLRRAQHFAELEEPSDIAGGLELLLGQHVRTSSPRELCRTGSPEHPVGVIGPFGGHRPPAEFEDELPIERLTTVVGALHRIGELARIQVAVSSRPALRCCRHLSTLPLGRVQADDRRGGQNHPEWRSSCASVAARIRGGPWWDLRVARARPRSWAWRESCCWPPSRSTASCTSWWRPSPASWAVRAVGQECCRRAGGGRRLAMCRAGPAGGRGVGEAPWPTWPSTTSAGGSSRKSAATAVAPAIHSTASAVSCCGATNASVTTPGPDRRWAWPPVIPETRCSTPGWPRKPFASCTRATPWPRPPGIWTPSSTRPSHPRCPSCTASPSPCRAGAPRSSPITGPGLRMGRLRR